MLRNLWLAFSLATVTLWPFFFIGVARGIGSAGPLPWFGYLLAGLMLVPPVAVAVLAYRSAARWVRAL